MSIAFVLQTHMLHVYIIGIFIYIFNLRQFEATCLEPYQSNAAYLENLLGSLFLKPMQRGFLFACKHL